jgi:hypothetical protein
MTNKLVVTKAVKLALDSVVDSGSWEKGEIIQKTIEKSWTTPLRKELNSMKLDDLVKALYEGYKLKDIRMEASPRPTQTQLTELVESYQRNVKSPNYSYEDGIADGIQFALEKLNIKVEGINLV